MRSVVKVWAVSYGSSAVTKGLDKVQLEVYNKTIAEGKETGIWRKELKQKLSGNTV